jgi:FkbM family methyltransferase
VNRHRKHDLELISRFQRCTPEVHANYVQDFLGTREYFYYAVQRLRYSFDCSSPYSLVVDENYFEWLDILESIVSARKTYTLLEVGAGYGRWTARAYMAARHAGFENRDIKLVTIEPEPVHSTWLQRHFDHNNIPSSCISHYECAVSQNEGGAHLFNVRPGKIREFEPYDWYGQALAHSDWENAEKISVSVRKLSSILEEIENSRIDLIDFDIQGEEPSVLLDIEKHLVRVARIHIGTNSLNDENFIRQFFKNAGWKKVRDYKGRGTRITYAGRVKFLDGVLTFINPNSFR